MALDLHTLAPDISGGIGGATITVGVPPGTADGDWILLVAVGGCADPVEVPGVNGFSGHAPIAVNDAGWVQVAQEAYAATGGDLTDTGMLIAVFYLAVDGTPPTEVTLNTGSDGTSWAIGMLRISNVAEPDDDSGIVEGTAADPSIVTVPSVTAAVDGSLLIYCSGSLSSSSTDIAVPPTGMINGAHVFPNQNTLSPSVGIFLEGVDSGPTGTRSQSLSTAGGGGINPAITAGLMLVVHLGTRDCADGRCFPIGTDKIFTNS